MSYDFPGKGKVAILRTRPETVIEDYARLMHLAEYDRALPKDKETFLKINISWGQWYPACSTAPWQLEGVIKTMLDDGYRDLIAAHNRTVVVDSYVGERNNKQKLVTDKYGLRNLHLYEPDVEWEVYTPKGEFLCLHEVYPDGVKIPTIFKGRNIIQLPTVKTHVFTTITGAMKNAFGGLLSENRHWTHARIHETVVDLLMIQREIHPGLFAVMDGTFAGDGPGPRSMRIHEKDVILASADQVAIDAISAKLQGFDPMSLDFIRLAHEKGLGIGDPKDIELVGDLEFADQNWGFIQTDTFASRGQKMIYHGILKPFEHLLLRTPIVPWSYAASWAYYDYFWYTFIGYPRVKKALETKWGRLFAEYGNEPARIEPVADPRVMGAVAGVGALAGLLGTAWIARKAYRKLASK